MIMKKNAISILSALMVFVMCLSCLVACANGDEQTATTQEKPETTQATATSQEPVTDESEPESVTVSETSETNFETTEIGSESTSSEVLSETVSETVSETDTSPTGPLLTGEYANLIENAYALKNGVQAYFTDAERDSFYFENQEMSLQYALSENQKKQVTVLTNKNGKNYLENTMDVFVKMTDGKTYYASDSYSNATANMYRIGYYFYEIRFEEQGFTDPDAKLENKRLRHTTYTKTKHLESIEILGGELVITNQEDATDPYVIFGTDLNYDADKYTMLEITMKTDEKTTGHAQFYLVAGEQTGFNAEQSPYFALQNDGQYHTYRIMLSDVAGYKGTLTGLRLDVSGPGASYSIKELKLVAPASAGAPAELGLNRSFMTYSDKMHHVIQIAARKATSDIAEVGMLTEISADTVAKLVVADKNGLQETLDTVDWDSAEYVAFDIIDAGIFGYILPFDGQGGRIEVTLENGVYSIIQTKMPPKNTILPSSKGTKNANDFYMGQRIYTDSSHSFDEFLKEAYCERHPLTNDNIVVHAEYSDSAAFEGYDSLRGIYSFTVAAPTGAFDGPFYQFPNRHFRTNFSVKSDAYDRSMYILVHNDIGTLECSVLLDKNDILLPVSIEVGKNFSEENGERNLYNIDDPTYSEALFPLTIKASSAESNYTLLNLYQNWGKYPLKQLSWIQFYAPYYHLSTGVTESNCILPWFTTKDTKSLNTLPDFRSMSAPLWDDQPQRNSCGTHRWLRYTDADGNYVTSESIYNVIDSNGPTYADVTMDYISDDGKIKVTYTHLEMPQTDENRTYYEIRYEVLEDVSFKDFSRDFEFYSVIPNDDTGAYTKIGYLNENNQSVVINVDPASTGNEYVLGKECPYFSFFDMTNYIRETGYANIGFLIYNSEFIIGGEKTDPSFAIIEKGSNEMVALTLALDEVTLKAGDKFTINAILLPWGSQESDYSGSAPDKNVREVRENTLLHPLNVVSDENCEVIESVYLPRIKTTDGESAAFTLSGGENNITVRVYGFEKMTVPVIYEKINGEWVEYVVSSKSTPDQYDNAHSYDGYNIHYDGDGTFSYSFVLTMKDGAARTFKLVADGNYSEWEKETVEIEKGFIDPASGYSETELIYTAHMDFINGQKKGTRILYFEPVPQIKYNQNAVSKDDVNKYGSNIIFSGWAVVEGGISKYVWSVDGGKTWHDASLSGLTALGTANDAVLTAASERANFAATFTAADATNANFQGSAHYGIKADLSAYAGQTVNLTFAAVPAAAEDTLILLYHLEGVTVVAE